MLNGKTEYGFYSEIQARLNGTTIYSTPNGKEVEVTAVGYSPDGSDCCQQPDKISLGEVVDWLRNGRKVPNQHIICYPKIDENYGHDPGYHVQDQIRRARDNK